MSGGREFHSRIVLGKIFLLVVCTFEAACVAGMAGYRVRGNGKKVVVDFLQHCQPVVLAMLQKGSKSGQHTLFL